MNGQQSGGAIQNLYYYIQERVTTDWSTEPGTAVVLSIVTCGIYGLYIFYKLMERRDRHLARMSNVAASSIALLKEKAAGREGQIGAELQQLDMIQAQMYEQSRERNAVLWLVLGIFFGIGILIGYYFIMDDLVRHDQLESQYFTVMSQALQKLGITTQASQAMPNIPERDFVTHLLLSIFTCGIYYFFWEYQLIGDGNIHVEAQVQWEDFIYQSLAA
jgi:uncharacterized protein YneF (UPF0154 family)